MDRVAVSVSKVEGCRTEPWISAVVMVKVIGLIVRIGPADYIEALRLADRVPGRIRVDMCDRGICQIVWYPLIVCRIHGQGQERVDAVPVAL